MSFDLRQYIDKAKYNSEGPVKGDILELQINKEIVIECDCDRIDNDITIAVDEIGYKILEQLGLLSLHDEQLESIEQIKSKAEKLNDANKGNVQLGKYLKGDPKTFFVYVEDPRTGNVNKVSFGDTTGLSITREDPARRNSFRARHDCSNPESKTKASRNWACRIWSTEPVSKVTKGN
jgi:hypothetical protein